MSSWEELRLQVKSAGSSVEQTLGLKGHPRGQESVMVSVFSFGWRPILHCFNVMGHTLAQKVKRGCSLMGQPLTVGKVFFQPEGAGRVGLWQRHTD